jgi:endonuclease/exonuclease/phosphatase (EEP) superfamily protein YafD
MAKALGAEYLNVLPSLPWTYDNSYFAPQDGLEKLTKLCRWAGLKFRSRLDYFFARNLKFISGEMLNLPGSDHRPLLAEFL